MTKRKKPGKNGEAKHLNQTAHQRAMKSPKTRAALSALREGWNGMSAEQLGGQLVGLIGFECSVRGIANELGKPESTIRRYIALAKSPETSSGWIEMMQRTIVKEPLTQKTKRAREVAGCKPSENPAKKGARPVIKEMYPVKDQVPSSTTQQTKKITSSSTTRAQERPLVKHALSEEESRPGEPAPKPSLVEQYKLSKGQGNLDKMRRLAAISDSIEPRPSRDARSMKRQGKPLPPIDPHGTVS